MLWAWVTLESIPSIRGTCNKILIYCTFSLFFVLSIFVKAPHFSGRLILQKERSAYLY